MHMYETIPDWKMPEDEKIPHKYFVTLKIDFIYGAMKGHPSDFKQYIGDLTKYYEWTKKHNIEMEHNIMIYGNDTLDNLEIVWPKIYRLPYGVIKSKGCRIMFTFTTEEHKIKFNKRWSDFERGIYLIKNYIDAGIVGVPFTGVETRCHTNDITITVEVWDFDQTEIKAWLDESCRGEWNKFVILPKEGEEGINVRMYFKEESDAVMFKLRWVEYEVSS